MFKEFVLRVFLKRLLIYIMFLLILILTIPVTSSDKDLDTIYNDEERLIIEQADPIKLCVDPDWYPYEMLDSNGNHVGIGAELITLIEQRSGLKFEIVPTANWKESILYSQTGSCDGLSMLNKTDDRSKWLVFTKAYFVDPNVLITREEHDYVTDISRLMGESVVLPIGTSVEEDVRDNYPNLNIILVENESTALDYVSSKKADMTIRSLTLAASVIKREGLFNLKISGELPELENQFRIGLTKDNAALVPILDKAIATITPQEIQEIINHHISIEIKKGIDYRVLMLIIISFFVIVGAITLWNLQLRNLNKKLDDRQNELLRIEAELKIKNALLSEQNTFDRLTGIYNRAFFEQRMTEILNEQERYGTYELVLCLFDLDYFKQVNDTFGHDQGDQVLMTIAKETKRHLRTSDVFARWGGEEFVILFVHTPIEHAVDAAEKIRKNLEYLDHDVVGKVTVSMGVTQKMDTESYESWFKRADKAMYNAKRSGRNKVFIASAEDSSINMTIDWNSSWNCGNAHIDEQHRYLLELGNQLITYLIHQEYENIVSVMNDLLQHISLHFETEEKLLTTIHYEGLEYHRLLHRSLVTKGLNFKEKLLSNAASPGDAVNFIVNTIILDHMVKEDMKYYELLSKRS